MALYLADKGVIPPKEWCHDPLIVNEYGNTVAMKLALNKIEPPDEWVHDSKL